MLCVCGQTIKWHSGPNEFCWIPSRSWQSPSWGQSSLFDDEAGILTMNNLLGVVFSHGGSQWGLVIICKWWLTPTMESHKAVFVSQMFAFFYFGGKECKNYLGYGEGEHMCLKANFFSSKYSVLAELLALLWGLCISKNQAMKAKEVISVILYLSHPSPFIALPC